MRLDQLVTVPFDRCRRVARLTRVGVDHAIRSLVKMFTRVHYGAFHRPVTFQAGISAVPVGARVYGHREMESLVDAALDFWLTSGRFNTLFEQRFADYIGVKYALTTNSGSSANLLAVSALTSPKLGKKRLKPGDEVITAAAGFPTTLSPIVQNGLKPVFVDIDIPTYNVRTELLEKAVSRKPGPSSSPIPSGTRSMSTKSCAWPASTTCGWLRTAVMPLGPDTTRMPPPLNRRLRYSAAHSATWRHSVFTPPIT